MIKQTTLLNHKPRVICNVIAEGDAKVTPVIVNVNNTYENENAPKEISFSVSSEKYEKMVVKSELMNHYDEFEFLQEDTISSGDTISAKLPDLSDIYGVFYLVATVYDTEGNKILCQHIPFSHIRVGDGYLKHSGMGTHLVVSGDVANCKKHYNIIKKCGIREVRDDLLWRACEKEKGVVKTVEGYIGALKDLKDNDMVCNVLFLYGNDFYDNGLPPTSQEAIDAYVNYIKVVMNDIKGTTDRCEIWNEYNLSGFNGRNFGPEDYAKMLKPAYEAIKAIDPNMKVSAGVTSGTHPQWIRRLLEAGAYDYFDAISMHPYCGWPGVAYPDENQGEIEANAQSYIDIIKEYGEEKPVWISEMGWTSFAQPNMPDRHVQAAAIARTFVIAESSQVLDRVVLYEYHSGSDEFYMEAQWGIIDVGIVPAAAKEAYVAISTLNWLIGNAKYESKLVTGEIKHTTFDENGKKINVFWSLDGAKDVSIELGGDAVAYDSYGNEFELDVVDGVAIVNIDEAPTYIVGPCAKVLTFETPAPTYEYPYTVSAVPELREDGWYLKALVKCHQFELNGRIRIELPELDISGNYGRFKIKDGESFYSEIKVGFDVDPNYMYRAFIDLSLTDGTYIPIHELVSFLGVPYGKPETTTFTLDSDKHYVNLTDKEPMHIKGDFALSYDEENLYFKAYVEDPVHLQVTQSSNTWKDIWDGDGIEMIIQPLNDGNKHVAYFNHIGLAVTSNTNESIAWRWRTVPNRNMTRIRDCYFKGERKDNITEYTFTIKWRNILPANVKYSDCDSFGFTLRLNNSTDNPDLLEGYSQIYGGMGSWRRPFSFIPSEFGRFVLLPKKD